MHSVCGNCECHLVLPFNPREKGGQKGRGESQKSTTGQRTGNSGPGHARTTRQYACCNSGGGDLHVCLPGFHSPCVPSCSVQHRPFVGKGVCGEDTAWRTLVKEVRFGKSSAGFVRNEASWLLGQCRSAGQLGNWSTLVEHTLACVPGPQLPAAPTSLFYPQQRHHI